MKAMPITITRAFFFKLFKIDADLWFSIALSLTENLLYVYIIYVYFTLHLH